MPFGRRRNRIDRSLRERGVPPEPQHKEREVVETTGPWDVADAPDDGLTRVDLGALPGGVAGEVGAHVVPDPAGARRGEGRDLQQRVAGAQRGADDLLLLVEVDPQLRARACG